MRLKILFMTIMAGLLFIGGVAYADEKDFPITGEVDLGVRSVQDGDKSAKFNEYRDMSAGVYSNMRFGGDNGSSYLGFTGENVGRDDQFFEVKGGQFGSYDYSLHYNEIIHNLTFGARTFYTGIGTSNLDYGYANRAKGDTVYTPNVPTDSTQWNTFDFSIKRKDTGASADFTFGTPFSISVDANQLEIKGVQPRGAASSVARDFLGNASAAGGGNPQVDLAAPIDYRTNNVNVKAGYNTKKYAFSLSGSLSNFENKNSIVNFRTPGATTSDQTEQFSEAENNNYYKLSAQGSVRQLPLNSTLALQVGESQLKNEFNPLKTVINSTVHTATLNPPAANPTYSTTTLGLNNNTFTGNIIYDTASVALTSQPVKAVDTKIYVNYLRKQSKSTDLEYSNPAFTSSTIETEVLNYRKYNMGADAGYKVTQTTKATVGYQFEQVDRNRVDFDNTTDNSVYGEIKNSSLGWLTAKAKYQRLWRNSQFQEFTDGTSGGNYLQYFRRRDAANKIQDTVKLSLDIDPTERLNIGLAYTYKANDYRDTPLGRTSDTRNEYYTDAVYTIPDVVKFTAFFDYETVRNHDVYRSSTTTLAIADPAANSTSSAYTYSAEIQDSNYSYGVGLEAPVIKNKLDFVASWTYEQANGGVNFGIPSVGQVFTSTTAFVDIPNYDDYQKESLNLKAIYRALKNLDLTLGYAYEYYNYNDISMNSYMYVNSPVTAVGVPNSFLSGANFNQSYNVNLFYVQAGYKF